MQSRPTAFLMHPVSSLHDTGWGHPEHQGRLRALAAALGRDLPALHDRVESVEPEAADERVLFRVHDRAHVELVKAAALRAGESGGPVELDADTRVSAASWDAALASVGGAIAAARGVVGGRWANAFVATRPPGHHATPDRAMGFCLFNNVAVTARWLQAEGHAARVAIVDWDVHHGNGTQDVFWEDASVFFLSLHQSPHWPGTGREDERGDGPGLGTTLNVPIPARTSAADYRERYEAALDRVFAWRPDFVLVSAGLARAEGACGGRVVALLEGGYDPGRTGAGALSVVRALAGVDPLGETTS
jgi:acetoin utilization deacetylase AcuC-like enzyme